MGPRDIYHGDTGYLILFSFLGFIVVGLALWISSSSSMAELPGLNIVFVVHAFDIVTFI